jgi:hypothetical protein
VDYSTFTSAAPEGPDPGEGDSSFSMGKVPLSFSADPSPEFLESKGKARRGYAGPVLYSLLIHSMILLLLLAVLYQPDRRPVKEVSHSVINLVSTIKDGPKGPQSVLPEETHAISGPVQPTPEPPAPVSANEKISSDESVPSFQESPLDSLAVPDSPSAEFPPASSPSEEKKPEGAAFAMKQSAGQQLQMGQYLFRMRMGDRMIGTKIKYFQKTSSAHLSGLIQGAIPEDLRKTLQGKSTVVRILYQEDGTLKEILFDPGSDGSFIQLLKDGIQWDAMSAPGKFGLPFREMHVRIAIDPEGKPSTRITLL